MGCVQKEARDILGFDANPSARTVIWQLLKPRGEKRGGFFFFRADSSVMWRASTPDLLSDGLVLEKLVPVELQKKNEVQYVLIWLMDGFSAVLRLLHASYFVIKMLF